MEFLFWNGRVNSSIDPFPSKTTITSKNDKKRRNYLKFLELSDQYTASEEILKKIY